MASHAPATVRQHCDFAERDPVQHMEIEAALPSQYGDEDRVPALAYLLKLDCFSPPVLLLGCVLQLRAMSSRAACVPRLLVLGADNRP